jgi:hypothetical protein
VSPLTAPPPILGGSRVYCPMVDVAAIETGRKQYQTGIHDLTCYWRRRGITAATLKAYRRHWRRKHWGPFTSEQSMQYLTPHAEVTVTVEP